MKTKSPTQTPANAQNHNQTNKLLAVLQHPDVVLSDEDLKEFSKALKVELRRRSDAAKAAAPKAGEQVRIVKGPKSWLGKTGTCVATGNNRLAIEVPSVGTHFASLREVERVG